MGRVLLFKVPQSSLWFLLPGSHIPGADFCFSFFPLKPPPFLILCLSPCGCSRMDCSDQSHRAPEHHLCFSNTCYPFISCFSQPQILPFYSSAIWQPLCIPFHCRGDMARGKQEVAVSLVDRPTSRRSQPRKSGNGAAQESRWGNQELAFLCILPQNVTPLDCYPDNNAQLLKHGGKIHIRKFTI